MPEPVRETYERPNERKARDCHNFDLDDSRAGKQIHCT